MPSLQDLNDASTRDFVALLDGIYEHSPWIAEAAAAKRPFATPAALKRALVVAVREAGRDAQLALIRAHPELAGKAMVSKTLTAESTNEQGRAGLTDCSAAEFARLQQLNADYNAKFGWPFILAVRGPRGRGLSRAEIIATFERRLAGHPDFEFAECLRHIHRIAEIRLDERFGLAPVLGEQVWDWAEALAAHSDPGFAEAGQLTVTYATAAHQACARQLQGWMRDMRLRRGGHRCGRQRGRRLSRQRSRGQAAADGLALRHRAQRRQVRRPARHPGADGGGAASCTAPAGACPSASRSSPSPKRKASATRPPSSARARSPATSTPPGWTSRTPTA